jgi:FixJ family two-component response regulator
MSSAEPTVFVVDDELSVRQSLSRLLGAAGLKVVAFDCAEAFLERCTARVPGCLVLDLAMPGLNGLQLQETLAASGSLLSIIFLTGQGDLPSGVKAMKRGAVDFLSKPVDGDDLIQAVRAGIDKARIALQTEAELTEIRRRLTKLTPREYEVLRHVVSGKLNKQIAAELGTVEKTVKVHRARVMGKLKATSLAELVRITERAGIQPL